MIRVELGAARIIVRPGATDMRKQINGLVVLVQEQMDAKLRELNKKLDLYEEQVEWFKNKLYGRGTEHRADSPSPDDEPSAAAGAAADRAGHRPARAGQAV